MKEEPNRRTRRALAKQLVPHLTVDRDGVIRLFGREIPGKLRMGWEAHLTPEWKGLQPRKKILLSLARRLVDAGIRLPEGPETGEKEFDVL